ncbi:MAG: hypothetical protein HUU60_04930 [Armatimonadetes bacterium]|nr:hypothetical protein [Armatimonadota bacterium]
MARRDDTKKISQDYQFFQRMARERKSFTLDEWKAECRPNMRMESLKTYISKHTQGLVEAQLDGRYAVKRKVLRLDFEDFAMGYRQANPPVHSYIPKEPRRALVFDFFMPLTHERRLRTQLDRLFHHDGLVKFVDGTEDEDIRKCLRSCDALRLDIGELRTAVVEFMGRLFSGYSISHVSGRFRITDVVKSRKEAAELVEKGDQYLADETTAVVRFIVPLGSDSKEDQLSLQMEGLEWPSNEGEQISIIREFFHLVIVQTIVESVKGEDEIWVLENGPEGPQLGIWGKPD